MIKIAAYCIVNASTSYMSYLSGAKNASLIYQMDSIIDGLTVYQSYYSTMKTMSSLNIFKSISDTIYNWVPIYNGIVFDQPGLLDLYNNFVYQNNVTTIQYVFNSGNCTVQACYVISNITKFNASENANNITLVQQLFQYLQNYIKSEITLIGNMIQDLTGSSSSTPNSALKTAQSKLLGVSNDVNSVSRIFPGSLQKVSGFNGGFFQYTNCTFINNSFNDLEASTCFAFKSDLLMLSLLILATLILEIGFMWMFWLGLRQIKIEGPGEYVTTENESMMDNQNVEKSVFRKN